MNLTTWIVGLLSAVGASAQIVVGPNVNVSRLSGNQVEAAIAINPTNPNNLFAFSNTDGAGLFAAFSTDGGNTWTFVDPTDSTIADGDLGDPLPPACCDPSAAFDDFGNLFIAYLNDNLDTGPQVEVALSTDGGQTFTHLDTLGIATDQETIVTGPGSVWVTYKEFGRVGTPIVAHGAAVTGLGAVGAFSPARVAPGSAAGSFGDIVIGPAGQVLVTYQDNIPTEGPSTIFVNRDPDGLGPAGFGTAVAATTTNVGGFDSIPPQPDRSVDAEAGLAYDRSGGPFDGRVYLVYTDETVNENDDTDIFVRFSDDDGATWSDRVRVNDDATTRSQFLPRIAVDQTTGNIAVSWHDARNDNGLNGTGDTDGVPNTDAQFFGTLSTDGGATFLTNVQISFTSNQDPAGGIDYGDYTGLAFFGDNVHPVWADNSNSTGDNPNGTLSRFDIYTAKVSVVAGVLADLFVTKTDSPDPVTVGQNLTYTVTVTNNGPDTAMGVIFTDSLPSGVTFVSATPSQGSCTPAGGVVTCDLGTLTDGASATVTIIVTPTASGEITNTASVTGNETDPTTANNTATAVTTVRSTGKRGGSQSSHLLDEATREVFRQVKQLAEQGQSFNKVVQAEFSLQTFHRLPLGTVLPEPTALTGGRATLHLVSTKDPHLVAVSISSLSLEGKHFVFRPHIQAITGTLDLRTGAFHVSLSFRRLRTPETPQPFTWEGTADGVYDFDAGVVSLIEVGHGAFLAE